MISVIFSLFYLGFRGAELDETGTFSKKTWVVSGGDSQFIVETMMPDFGHIVPVGDNTVLDGISEREDTLLGLGLGTDISFLFIHAYHHVLVFGSSYD
jgi:hypothetical protein